MFRKYYKAANDDIQTNRELIDKVFENFSDNNTTKKRSKVYNFGMRYGTAFAAVLVLCVAVASYPQIIKLNKTPIIEESNQIKVSDAKFVEHTEAIKLEAEVNIQHSEETINNSQKSVVANDESVATKTTAENKEVEYTSRERIADVQTAAQYDFSISFSDVKSVSETETESAVKTLTEKLGKEDTDSGKLYVFEIVGKFDSNEETYYLGRWKWLVVDHTSLLTEFVLNSDLSKMYECYHNDNTISWNTEVNIFE
ncbi:MAG: hypothetical protein IKW62_03480 [Clostridia bacterium]|nr:hypothetical protein [Clostridia bacterium]